MHDAVKKARGGRVIQTQFVEADVIDEIRRDAKLEGVQLETFGGLLCSDYGKLIPMSNPAPTPAFLRGNLEHTSTVASAWIRGLESTEEQIMKWTTGLSHEGLWWSATPDSNTIGGLINHIRTTNLRLLHFAQGIPLPAELNKTPAEQLASTGEGLETLLRHFVASQAQLKAALAAMTPTDLETPRERLGQWVPALHLCHKLVEHSHEHVGQIITLRKLWNARNP